MSHCTDYVCKSLKSDYGQPFFPTRHPQLDQYGFLSILYAFPKQFRSGTYKGRRVWCTVCGKFVEHFLDPKSSSLVCL